MSLIRKPKFSPLSLVHLSFPITFNIGSGEKQTGSQIPRALRKLFSQYSGHIPIKDGYVDLPDSRISPDLDITNVHTGLNIVAAILGNIRTPEEYFAHSKHIDVGGKHPHYESMEVSKHQKDAVVPRLLLEDYAILETILEGKDLSLSRAYVCDGINRSIRRGLVELAEDLFKLSYSVATTDRQIFYVEGKHWDTSYDGWKELAKDFEDSYSSISRRLRLLAYRSCKFKLEENQITAEVPRVELTDLVKKPKIKPEEPVIIDESQNTYRMLAESFKALSPVDPTPVLYSSTVQDTEATDFTVSDLSDYRPLEGYQTALILATMSSKILNRFGKKLHYDPNKSDPQILKRAPFFISTVVNGERLYNPAVLQLIKNRVLTEENVSDPKMVAKIFDGLVAQAFEAGYPPEWREISGGIKMRVSEMRERCSARQFPKGYFPFLGPVNYTVADGKRSAYLLGISQAETAVFKAMLDPRNS